MATQIEILAVTPERATVALYYAVAKVPGTADPTRTPRGKNVAAVPAELAALRDGTLIEVVKTLAVAGLAKPEKRALIEAAWAVHRAEAEAAHAAKNADKDFTGAWWDGATWTMKA